MENDNSENVGYAFLRSNHSQQVFGKLDSALKQFERLGWMKCDNDHFELLASFQRLPYVYDDVIRNINQIIARYQ